MHSPSATEPAAPVFCTRGGAPPGQIPRFTFQEQFATTSLLKKEFLVVFWRSTYFYFEAHNLLRHPKFSSTNLKKKKNENWLNFFQDPKWSGGQAGHWPAACAHSILPAVRSNPAGQQSNRSSFFQMNLKSAILKSNHRLSHYEKSELAWGESWRDHFVTHSVLNGGVHCPRNPTQIWTLHQPSL